MLIQPSVPEELTGVITQCCATKIDVEKSHLLGMFLNTGKKSEFRLNGISIITVKAYLLYIL